MIDEHLECILKIIGKRLSDHKVKWALVGGANLKVQGMEIDPKDVDIVVQRKDLQKVSSIFSKYSSSAVRELDSLTGQSAWEVNAKINDMDIHFIAGGGKDVYVSKLLGGKTETIELDGIGIPCFTLEAESQAYKETNRKEKAQRIQEFLHGRKKSAD